MIVLTFIGGTGIVIAHAVVHIETWGLLVRTEAPAHAAQRHKFSFTVFSLPVLVFSFFLFLCSLQPGVHKIGEWLVRRRKGRGERKKGKRGLRSDLKHE